jgi:hypothetical protein
VSSNITPLIVHYLAQECAWQQSGELSVARMVDAWRYAHRSRKEPIRLRHVLALGRAVEPYKNQGGLRRVGVRVGWDEKMDSSLVSSALDSLVENQPEIGCSDEDATEWFRQYEEIHPFVDGNGRTGSLLYNHLRGTLERPTHAPNLWGDPRRNYPSYPHVAANP